MNQGEVNSNLNVAFAFTSIGERMNRTRSNGKDSWMLEMFSRCPDVLSKIKPHDHPVLTRSSETNDYAMTESLEHV
jgi:hypothetical protein